MTNPSALPQHDARHIDYPASYPAGTVVLVSGGVDSLINADGHPDAELLFVDLGHADAAMELQACRRLFYMRSLHVASVAFGTSVPTSAGVFLPARNMLLACLAVHYGSDIVFGAMADDHSVDKTAEAFASMARLLTEQSGRTVTVRTPLLNDCKHGAVSGYLATGDRADRERRMRATWSCYGRGPDRCMDCKNCFRWSVALRYAGIDVALPSRRISGKFMRQIGILSETEQVAIRFVLEGARL